MEADKVSNVEKRSSVLSFIPGAETNDRGTVNSSLAGRGVLLFRPCYFSGCLLLLMTLLLPAVASAQSSNSLRNQQQADLISTLLKLSDAGKERIQTELNKEPTLITTSLWEALNFRATAAYQLNGLEQSLRLYDIAIVVAERLQDKRRLATTYYNIGRAYAGAFKVKEAIQAYLNCKNIFEEVGLQRDLIYIFGELGSLHFYSQDYKQARAYAEQSLRLADALKNSRVPAGALPDEYGVAAALSTLGGLYEYEGNYAEAMRCFHKSFKLYQGLDKGGLRYGFQMIDAQAAIGRVYNSAGDNAQALIFLNQALALAKRLPYKDRTASVLNNLGMLYLEQEDYDQATYYFTQSLRINQSLKNQFESAKNLLNLGVVFQRRGENDQALEKFRAALRQVSDDSNKDVTIAAAEGIGAVYKMKGDFAAALQSLDGGLQMAKEINDRTRIAELLWRKAEVLFAQKEYALTEKLAQESLTIARQLRFANLEFLATTLWGQALQRQGRANSAIEAFSQAIEQSEQMRGQVVGREQQRQIFFENKLAPYRALMEITAERQRPDDALLYAERAKGRVLHELLRKGAMGRLHAQSDSEKEEDQRLNQTIVDLNNRIREERLKPAPDLSTLKEIQDQLRSVRLEYASFQNLIRASHPDSSDAGITPPSTTAALDALGKDAHTAFLEYAVTPERTYLFVLTKKSPEQKFNVTVNVIPVASDTIGKLVGNFRRLMTTRSLTLPSVSREFYDLLLKPAEEQIQGQRTLCIIPDGILWEAPFQAAISNEGHYMIEDHSIYYAPSLSVLIEITKRKSSTIAPSTESLLAFGNPITGPASFAVSQSRERKESFEPLPEAETEVKRLAELVGRSRSRVFIGAAADERTFKQMAPFFRTIHFATHGMLDNQNPLYSYLLLAKNEADDEDGLVEAREIMGMKLNADLVVLSACETARGRIGAGEGMVGMSWAFFAAGCRATVVSQWNVESATTSELMIHFYQALKEGSSQPGISKADALRAAALKLIKDHRYEHPVYWAGFVLVGSNN